MPFDREEFDDPTRDLDESDETSFEDDTSWDEEWPIDDDDDNEDDFWEEDDDDFEEDDTNDDI